MDIVFVWHMYTTCHYFLCFLFPLEGYYKNRTYVARYYTICIHLPGNDFTDSIKYWQWVCMFFVRICLVLFWGWGGGGAYIQLSVYVVCLFCLDSLIYLRWTYEGLCEHISITRTGINYKLIFLSNPITVKSLTVMFTHVN